MRNILVKFIFTAAGIFLWSLAANAAAPEMQVPRGAGPFSLADVKLLAGPFRDAMVRDQKYLLSLDPDRLLHTFRLNVSLPSSAQPLSGWEAPDCQLRGHSLGHYFSALSLMYASTGDARFTLSVNSPSARVKRNYEDFPRKINRKPPIVDVDKFRLQ